MGPSRAKNYRVKMADKPLKDDEKIVEYTSFVFSENSSSSSLKNKDGPIFSSRAT